MDPFYAHLHLPLSAKPRDVIRSAAAALHPWIRHHRGLRLARRRFYRDMLNSHDLAQELARSPAA